jgi:hypothetical protein
MVSPSGLWEINKGNPHEMNIYIYIYIYIYMMSKEIKKVKMCVYDGNNNTSIVNTAGLLILCKCLCILSSLKLLTGLYLV